MTNYKLGDCTCLHKRERDIIIGALSAYNIAMAKESETNPRDKEIYNKVIKEATDMLEKVGYFPLC